MALRAAVNPISTSVALCLCLVILAIISCPKCAEAHAGCKPSPAPQPPAGAQLASAADPPVAISSPAPTSPVDQQSDCKACEPPAEWQKMEELVFKPSFRAKFAAPPIVEEVMQKYLKPGVLNMAAGCSYWGPPTQCLEEVSSLVLKGDTDINRYGDVGGLPELRERLKEKLKKENKIEGRDVMVTAGANQAFVNVIEALLDAGDRAVLFSPFYFSHQIALELANADIQVAECDEDMQPDLESLQEILEQGFSDHKPIKAVIIVTPGNPSGVVITKERLDAVVELTRKFGAWIICDETYEYFTYDGAVHHSAHASDGVINIYSMSKAYGMAGWRIGYVAYPKSIRKEMEKVQDTIITMAPIISQRVALKALDAGKEWVAEKIKTLQAGREKIWDAVEPLNPYRSEGAFYFFVPLPSVLTEEMVLDMLATRHNVLLTPGSAFGMPNHLRVSYGSLSPAMVEEAGARLVKGFTEICRSGLRLAFDNICSHPFSNGREGTWGPPVLPEGQLLHLESKAKMSTNIDGVSHLEDH